MIKIDYRSVTETCNQPIKRQNGVKYMKCSKCGYDYPAKETKCPYCGEPNKLGMEWEKEEDETRKETLLTKAKVLHSMPLYVANKIMNIILLLAVYFLLFYFLSFSFWLCG